MYPKEALLFKHKKWNVVVEAFGEPYWSDQRGCQIMRVRDETYKDPYYGYADVSNLKPLTSAARELIKIPPIRKPRFSIL